MNGTGSINAIRLAVVGDFQIGKSSLVNCLLSDSLAETGEGFFPTTDTASEYPFAPGIVLVDTPGFDDDRPELARISESCIRDADAILFIKTDKILGEHDETILRIVSRKPLIVVFNCWDRTHGRRGWIPELPENRETCETIRSELEQFGMGDSVLHIGVHPICAVNVLWAQFGLGLGISNEQQDDILDFAKTKLGLKLEENSIRAEMLRRSGFLPVRDFLNNLPLELLKYVVSNPQREIDRIVDRFAAEFKKRWTAA